MNANCFILIQQASSQPIVSLSLLLRVSDANCPGCLVANCSYGISHIQREAISTNASWSALAAHSIKQMRCCRVAHSSQFSLSDSSPDDASRSCTRGWHPVLQGNASTDHMVSLLWRKKYCRRPEMICEMTFEQLVDPTSH
jgi:hypothetical protein